MSFPDTTKTKGNAMSLNETNQVINNFDGLSPKNQQDLVNFLRSL